MRIPELPPVTPEETVKASDPLMPDVLPTVDDVDTELQAAFRQRIATCKQHRNKLVKNWETNIDYRRGKPFSSQSDDDRIAVNMDWGLTKTKQASLFSQVPQVRVNHPPESVSAGPWVAAYERKLNDTLVTAGIEAAMEELVPDCVNAAGFGAALVSYEALTEEKEVPSIDLLTLPPQLQMEAKQFKTINGKPIPTERVPVTVDHRYTIRRISPSDFLWPIEFTGSDFNVAPWLGHSGRITWAEAKSRFKLSDADKDKVTVDETNLNDRLSTDIDKATAEDEEKVGFDEIFYHDFQYNTNCKSYGIIKHLVFLHGKTKAVIHEQWKGQRLDPNTNMLIGSTLNPLQALTLTYVTDENIPPSDTAIGRAQVNELNKGRTQVNRQRERNISSIWYDVNRLDPSIQQSLMQGTWQRAIPVQGEGSRIIGPIAQSHIAAENFTFDRIAKQDLQEQWTVGLGSGEEAGTKSDGDLLQASLLSKIGRERARVVSFICNISKVVGGLVCLYEDPKSFGEGFNPGFSNALNYSILADSTILLDVKQRLDRMNMFVNMYGKSGWVNLEPVLKEIATLSGLDPNTVIVKPEPATPEMPNISLRLTGGEDMTNPLLLAFLIKSGQAPAPELIEQAKQLIQQAVVMPQPPAPPTDPNNPMMPPTGDPNAPVPAPPPGAPTPMPPPPGVGEANPQMSLMPKISKRSNDVTE